ncbi:MAG: heme biosynthesis protein HemY, partial [Thiomicrospira sp.]|uniref:heme biosynthesis HemY N-terminal domain-containing protein n=1 Tax=Thiomicrospira sp. TaxID=935 RepID=UPI0019D951C7
MKKLIGWGLILIFAVSLTSLALLNIGEVTLKWDVWEINTSVSLVLAGLIVLLMVFYALIRIWLWLKGLPAAWRKRRQIKRYRQAQMSLSKGLIAQEESDWAQAEKQLIKTAKLSENGLVHYLTAAKMADMQQASARRDKYLAQARELYPEDGLTIGLVEARLIRDQDASTAAIILSELHRLQPNHRAVLSEYVSLLRQQKQAETLMTLMPAIKKHAGLNRDDLEGLETEVSAMRLAKAANLEDLEAQWKGLSTKQKLSPPVMAEYVQYCLQAKQLNGVAEWLDKAIKAQWDERLVYLYGQIQFGPAYDRLKKAQAWLKEHPDNPVLLLSLGRLACQSQLWGQAHGYLRESLRLRPELETFHILAQCYEAEGQDSQAALVYKQAMLQLDPPTKP